MNAASRSLFPRERHLGTLRREIGSPTMEDRDKRLRDTDRTAGFNMMKFVVTIFVVALAVAAVWFFVLTPGDPSAISGS